MKTPIQIISFLIVTIACLSARLPKDPKEYAEWEARMLAGIERNAQLSAEEAIQKLSYTINQMDPRDRTNVEKGDTPVFKAAQAQLLKIPSHAQYLGKEIDFTFERATELDADGNLVTTNAWLSFEKTRSKNLRTLEMLPSVETVRVLGEMLDNDFTPEGSGIYKGKHVSLALMAAYSLSQLPIANPPTPRSVTGDDRRNNFPAWKQWYAEVEAGKRTFRFVGDPVDYDLRGASKRGAITPTPRRDMRGGGANETSEKSPMPESPAKPSAKHFLVAALFLLGAGIFYWLRKKRHKS